MLLCSLIAQTTLVWHPCHRGARNLRRHREDFPQAFLLQVRLGFHLSVLWPVVSEVVASSRMLCLPAFTAEVGSPGPPFHPRAGARSEGRSVCAFEFIWASPGIRWLMLCCPQHFPSHRYPTGNNLGLFLAIFSPSPVPRCQCSVSINIRLRRGK